MTKDPISTLIGFLGKNMMISIKAPKDPHNSNNLVYQLSPSSTLYVVVDKVTPQIKVVWVGRKTDMKKSDMEMADKIVDAIKDAIKNERRKWRNWPTTMEPFYHEIATYAYK